MIFSILENYYFKDKTVKVIWIDEVGVLGMIRTEYHIVPIIFGRALALYLLYRYIKVCIRNNKKKSRRLLL